MGLAPGGMGGVPTAGLGGMKYLVTGSRDWGSWRACEAFVRALRPGDEVAHGDARGADSMVHDLLTNKRNRQRGTLRARRIFVHSERATGTRPGGRRGGDIDVHVYPADWDRYQPEDPARRNPAGPIRNAFMLRDFRPDRVVYFHDSLEVGAGGTGHMVKIASAASVPVYAWEDFVELQKSEED